MILLIPRNKIAIHAKHQTIMYYDLQLLRDLWKSIVPESALEAQSNDSVRQKEQWQAHEKHPNKLRHKCVELEQMEHFTSFLPASNVSVECTRLISLEVRV